MKVRMAECAMSCMPYLPTIRELKKPANDCAMAVEAKAMGNNRPKLYMPTETCCAVFAKPKTVPIINMLAKEKPIVVRLVKIVFKAIVKLLIVRLRRLFCAKVSGRRKAGQIIMQCAAPAINRNIKCEANE